MAARNGKLPLATFEQIQSADDTLSDGEIVEMPEWKASVKVRGLTRGESRLAYKLPEAEDREASILGCGFVEPKLSPEQAREIVNAKGFKTTERLLEKILELSGLAEPDVRPAAELLVEAATRNEDGTVTIAAPIFGQLESALGSTFRS